MPTVKNWQLGRDMLYPYEEARPKRQIGMVFNNTQISQRIDEFLSCVPQIIGKET